MIFLQTTIPQTTSIIKEIISYTTPINNLGPVLIAIFGGLLWRYYKRKEVEYKIVELRAQTFLNSNKAIWGLLKYLSNKDKPDSIFIWNSVAKEWTFNPINATRFTAELNKVYYTDGNGIMIEKKLRDKIFEIENKILKCTRDAEVKDKMVKMKHTEICDEIMKLKEELINELRKIVSKNNLLEHGKI